MKKENLTHVMGKVPVDLKRKVRLKMVKEGYNWTSCLTYALELFVKEKGGKK